MTSARECINKFVYDAVVSAGMLCCRRNLVWDFELSDINP